jgi:hypothetical protein
MKGTGYSLNGTKEAAMDTLYGGDGLRHGQQLRSNNGRYTLVMQHDGNLVLYEPGGNAVLDTGTWSLTPPRKPVRAEMQHDGNFVLYDVQSRSQWHSGTCDNPGSRIVLQDGRNLVPRNLMPRSKKSFRIHLRLLLSDGERGEKIERRSLWPRS